MPQPSLLEIFVSPLNRLAVPYVVTGATASIIYGEPRLTNDYPLLEEMVRRYSLEKEWRKAESLVGM